MPAATTQPTLFRSSSFSSPLPILPSAPSSPMMHHSVPPGDRQSSSSQRTPTRPALPHSVTSPTLSPHSTAQSPNYHPYRIRTSSSGVLTRSNSSPAQPLSSLAGHRPSRSMSNLREIADTAAPVLQDTANKDLIKRRSIDGTPTTRTRVGGPVHSRRSSQMDGGRTSSFSSNDGGSETSSMGGLRRSGSMISLKHGMEEGNKSITDLPSNPKVWSACELVRYIDHALATPMTINSTAVDSPTRTPQLSKKPLSPDVVSKIKQWIIEHDIQGRSFLRGGEGNWANTSTQPPFLPILLSLSRNLRRASLKGPVLLETSGHYYTQSTGSAYEDVEDSITSHEHGQTVTSPKQRSLHSRDSSVLQEEDEDEGVDNQQGPADLQTFAGAAHVLAGLPVAPRNDVVERAPSVDDSALATDDEESIHGEMSGARSRLSSVSSVRSIDSTGSPTAKSGRSIPGSLDQSRSKWGPYVSRRNNRTLSNASSVSQGGLANTETGTMNIKIDDVVATMRRVAGSKKTISTSGSNLGSPDSLVSPPLAYASESETSEAHPPYADTVIIETATIGLGIPDVDIQPAAVQPVVPESNTELSTQMSNMIKDTRTGPRLYGALRHTDSSGSNDSSNGRPRLPTAALRVQKSVDSGTADDLEREWNGGDRRVTIRPIRKVTEIFAGPSPDRERRDSSGTPTPHGRVASSIAGDAQLLEVIKDLTQRLKQAEARVQELQRDVNDSGKAAEYPGVQQGSVRQMWERFMTASPHVAVLPKDMQELPVYMLLVGVGLGVVVTKVLFGRSVRG